MAGRTVLFSRIFAGLGQNTQPRTLKTLGPSDCKNMDSFEHQASLNAAAMSSMCLPVGYARSVTCRINERGSCRCNLFLKGQNVRRALPMPCRVSLLADEELASQVSQGLPRPPKSCMASSYKAIMATQPFCSPRRLQSFRPQSGTWETVDRDQSVHTL